MRPGMDYLLASPDRSILAHLGPEVLTDCEGIYVVRVRLPEAVTDTEVRQLAKVGVEVRRMLSVQPGGLLPRGWLSRHTPEWLTTEAVIFFIDHDFQCNQLLVELDGIPISLAPTQGTRSILSLGHLDAGPHQLVIRATMPAAPVKSRALTPIELQFMVRPPSIWKPGQITHDGLVAHVLPQGPSIDHLLSSELSLRVEGSAGSVKCSLTLFDGNGLLLLDAELFHKNPPISNEIWQSALNKFLSAQRDEQPLFAAREGFLTLSARDIGSHRIRLRSDFKSLRWALDRTSTCGLARLLNDGIDQEEISVDHYRFDSPLERFSLNVNHAIEGLSTTTVCGLLVARTPEFEQAVIISPAQPAMLSTLVDKPQWRCDMSTNIAALVQAYRRWRSCRTSNGWARIRQIHVVSSIHRRLLAVMCGEYWVRNETEFDDRGRPWHALESLVDSSSPRSFGSALAQAWPRDASTDDLSTYATVARAHYGLDSRHGTAIRACWKAAGAPDDLLPTECEVIQYLEERLRGSLIRGARLWQAYRRLGRGAN
jgi:hypothetical protein